MLAIELGSLRPEDDLADLLVLLKSLRIELAVTLIARVECLVDKDLLALRQRDLFRYFLFEILFRC